MKQCEKGHFYDDIRFSACPYCKDVPAAAAAPPKTAFGGMPAGNVGAPPGGMTLAGAPPVGNRGMPQGNLPPAGAGSGFAQDMPRTMPMGTGAHTPDGMPGTVPAGNAGVPPSGMTPAGAPPVGNRGMPRENLSPAGAGSGFGGNMPKTMPVGMGAYMPDGMPRTMPVAQRNAPPVNIPANEAGKTVGLMQKKIGLDPAVGFLVCISGPNKGEDFRLRSGRNFLGRSGEMDVCLSKDEAVSRENHAAVTYDSRENAFMLAPGTGRGITYLNGAQAEAPVRLSAYDRIELGGSKLLFLPLCSEQFRWEEA